MASSERHAGGRSTRVDHETDEPDASPSRPNWLIQGQTIGRYVVLECLGVGGMGVIYSAWDPNLGRKLAIKVVRSRHDEIGSTRGRARLLREGQSLARLRHPNVISVHDVGTHEGRVFVAMEFVEGETLYRWLLRTPRPPTGQLLDVFLQVGRGLAAAHRAGLVHRDVKPENVMIGDDGRVLVLDFGIAREGYASDSGVLVGDEAEDDDAELDEDVDSDELDEPHPAPARTPAEREPGAPDVLLDDHTPRTALTRAGAVVGTPAYMSPEQHRGRPVDTRSDQFSYCVAMWEALHGDKPYGEGSRQKLLARMRLGQIRPPRNREVPRRVTVALRRGLSWNPRERFSSMEALLEALNPRGHSAERRLWHGLGIGAAGGMLIGVVATILSVGLRPSSSSPSCSGVADDLGQRWNPDRSETIAARFAETDLDHASASWIRTREQLDGWAARWIAAREQTCTNHFVEQRDSEALHDQRVACLDRQRERFEELLALLEQPDATVVEGAVAASVELPSPELCNDPGHLQRLDQLVVGPEPESASARQRLAELHRELDRLELELALGHPQLEPSRQLSAAAREADDAALLARALLVHARAVELSGDAAGAEELLLDAARTAASIGDPDTQARALIDAAAVISARGRQAEALRWLDMAEALAASSPEAGALEVEIVDTRAMVDRRQGRLEQARAGFDRARGLLEGAGDHPLQLPPILHHLAQVTAEIGDAAEAVRLLRRTLVLYEQAYGPAHPQPAIVRADLADALEALGERDAALGEYERAVELLERAHPGDHRTALVRSRLGAALARRGRCSDAWTPLTRAREQARTLAPGSLTHATTLESLARACEFGHAEAVALAREAVEIRTKLQGPAHPELAVSLAIEALALVAADDPEAALAELDTADAMLSELSAAPRQQALVHAARGLTLAALGRDDARAQLEAVQSTLDPQSDLAPRVGRTLAGLPR